MDSLIITFYIIILSTIIFIKKLYQKKNFYIIKRKKLDEYFKLTKLLNEIKEYYKKETKLIFCCEKLLIKYYSKLIIFNKEYNLNENTHITISINKTNPIKSDFTEKIYLKSDNGDTINFIINICYHIDNYYQLLLDKFVNPLSLEIVFYSQDNKFPQFIQGNLIKIKYYDNNNFPYLKRFNIINLSRLDLYAIYEKYSDNELKEESKLFIDEWNSLFINFIDKKLDNKYEGKIFIKKEDDLAYEHFNADELNLLEKTKEFITVYIKNNYLVNSSLVATLYLNYIKNIKDEIINSVFEKISGEYYFIKYFNDAPDNKLIELIEAGFFIEYMKLNKVPKNAVKLYIKYVKRKNEILKNENEFNNFEKLMILVSLHNLVLKDYNIKLLRLYDLPNISPFVASEKIYLDIIKEINEKSCLYFFYLQINSSSGIDYITLNTWYQIKYIPLIEIKAHLIFSRFKFFFIFDRDDKEPAFVDMQTLIKNYNMSEISTGYDIINNFESEKSANNTIKLLFYKLHENSHSKCNCKITKNFSPRYLYNFDLKVLDCHYDTIMEYKKGKKQDDSQKLGENPGEEGYVIEIFIYGDINKTDNLLNSSIDLSKFCDSHLYSGDDFSILKEMINGIKEDKNSSNIIVDNIYSKQTIVKRKNNIKNYQINTNKKNPIQFFKNCNEIGKY